MAKNFFDDCDSRKPKLPSQLPRSAESTLEYSLKVMSELVHWLVKSGIGHAEFSASLRVLFYNESIKELEYLDQRKTDSSISLLAGLNRRDVSTLRLENGGNHRIIKNFTDTLPVSVPARVIALWVHKNLPKVLNITGTENSFEYLVKQISTEKHPRSILSELKRIGLVSEEDGRVILHKESFTPVPEEHQTKQIFAENLADHLAAGVYNLTEDPNAFLEQAIFVDELSADSVDYLKNKTLELWEKFSKSLLAEAIIRCQEDEGRLDAIHRFRVGIYEFDAIDLNRKK
ncbi:DUF6502 family protein [Acinetobacter sp. SA01]|uniref:DUF6502 family protein n=1 Tax=Acinetobacter sp. SA01 TaxID=1862567 RepID=UPI001F0CEE6D|nr:DUF6502 family protein [Acinetobacter sp. SA01]